MADRPLTPMEVERRLENLSRLIDTANTFLKNAEADYHEAKATYEIEFARHLLASAERSEERRKADALLHVQEERRTLAIAEATVRAARANVDRLSEQVSIAQSQGALLRSALNVA